jgi:hypothetical protein
LVYAAQASKFRERTEAIDTITVLTTGCAGSIGSDTANVRAPIEAAAMAA